MVGIFDLHGELLSRTVLSTDLCGAGAGTVVLGLMAFTANLRLFGSRVYEALGVEADSFFLEQTDLVEATAVEPPAAADGGRSV